MEQQEQPGTRVIMFLQLVGAVTIVTIQHSINPDQPLVELLTSDQNEASLVNIETLILHNYIETMPHTAQCFQTNVMYNNVSQFAILSES